MPVNVGYFAIEEFSDSEIAVCINDPLSSTTSLRLFLLFQRIT